MLEELLYLFGTFLFCLGFFGAWLLVGLIKSIKNSA